MNISIVNSHHVARQVLERAIALRLNAQVTGFACVEDLLSSSMQYQVFILYSNMGHNMPSVKGVEQVRKLRADAFIIGVSDKPDTSKRFLPAGADVSLLRSGNEIGELVELIQGAAVKPT